MKKFHLALHWQILIALVAGVFFGMVFTEHVGYIEWMGVIFLRALRMVIIPLVIFSITSGVSQIGTAGALGRLGIKTILYYFSTSILAILTGLLFVNLIKPGKGADTGFIQEVEGLVIEGTSLGETLMGIIPENIFRAMSAGEILPVIFFSLLFGFFITRVDRKHKNILGDFFEAGFQVMMKLTLLIILITPIGVFGIIAGNVADILLKQGGDAGSLIEVAGKLGLYMLTVFISLSVHALLILPLIQRFIGKIHPWKHFRAVTTPLITAFSTSSAMATLPLTLEAVEHRDGVSSKISSFTLPLGATINMDGTALYECVAAVFIAQAYGLELSAVQQVLIVITALLASIGAAAIPMAGLFMISIILSAIGLPLEAVGMIVAVDRILDMFRTATNVWSDTTGAVVIARSEGEKLNVGIGQQRRGPGINLLP